MKAGAGLALFIAAGPKLGAAISSELDFASGYVPNPRIEDELTIREHDRGEMDSPLEYYDDSDELVSLADDGGEIRSRDDDDVDNDEPWNPLTSRADRIYAETYWATPRDVTEEDEDGDEEDVTALDEEQWTVDDTGTAGTITVTDDSSEAGGPGVMIDVDGTSDDTAIAEFSHEDWEITSGVGRRILQTVYNVDSVDAGTTVEIGVEDSAGNSTSAEIAEETGNGQVFQEQVGDMDGGEDLEDISKITVEVNDGSVDLHLVALGADTSTRWDFGTREYTDGDDDLDTETVREPSGEFSITQLGTMGDEFANATIVDLEVAVAIRAEGLPSDNVDYRFEDSPEYPEPQRFQAVVNFDLPAAFDLVYDDPELHDVGLFHSSRYLTVEFVTGEDDQVDLDDVDDDEVSGWVDVTDDYGDGEDVELTTSGIFEDEVTAVYFDLNVRDSEADDMQDAAAPGPIDDERGGFLGFLFSVPGMLASAVGGFGLWTWLRRRRG